MYENTAVSVMEMTRQWERGARMTGMTEAEQMTAVWRAGGTSIYRLRFREAVAKALIALAARLAPATIGEQRLSHYEKRSI